MLYILHVCLQAPIRQFHMESPIALFAWLGQAVALCVICHWQEAAFIWAIKCNGRTWKCSILLLQASSWWLCKSKSRYRSISRFMAWLYADSWCDFIQIHGVMLSRFLWLCPGYLSRFMTWLHPVTWRDFIQIHGMTLSRFMVWLSEDSWHDFI